MLIITHYFQYSDILLIPLCIFVLYFILRIRAERNTEKRIKQVYYKVFWYKLIFVFISILLLEFYFKGGDTSMYYQATLDMKQAVKDNPRLITYIAGSRGVDDFDPLALYFAYDNSDYGTLNYMRSSSNFFVPKLALFPAFLFNSSYFCICLFYSFFALGGAIRLFKTFYHYFPKYWKEIAVAVLFLPDVCYWSSGLLKDTICFGCIGYICYGTLNIFVKKQKIVPSVLWIILCFYLLFYIKAYILLVLIIAIVVWLFAEFNKIIRDKNLRRFFAIITFSFAALVTLTLLRYITAQEAASNYQVDKFLEQSANQRQQYGVVAEQVQGSYFQLETGNTIILMLNGIIATFFRPFPWEVRSPIMLFSALEAILFLSLTLSFIFKKGIGRFVKLSFSNSQILMCFVFAFCFSMAIGSTTTNFGALSRYKIPCMPFYFLMILLLYRKENLKYPGWLSWALKKV
jgi:hypothetical protein